MFRKHHGEVISWSVWTAPQGVAVDPCDAESFHQTYDIPVGVHAQDQNEKQFPGLQSGTWFGDWPEYQDGICSINGHGKDASPTLECEDSLVQEFIRDARYADPLIRCEDGSELERGWTVEY
jgi:hypothetical protein